MPKDFIPQVARAFPVCTASDEFYYFPQFVTDDPDWTVWDDFSEEGVLEFSDCLAGWEKDLGTRTASPGDIDEVSVDARTARRTLRTLREQLTLIRPQRSQPTFHLTVASIGLAEALESPDPQAWRGRVSGLPAFLDRALSSLEAVPCLFRETGEEMVRSFRAWLKSLQSSGHDTGSVHGALGHFEAVLRKAPVRKDFALPGGDLEMVVREHLGCGAGVEGLLEILSEEIAAMEEILEEETARLAPGSAWQEASRKVPAVGIPEGGAVELFRGETLRLEGHCRKAGLVPSFAPESISLLVRSAPPYLETVRASDSYAAAPGHPARGGTFFVFDRGRIDLSPDFRMTTAHETWPGHHLLDLCRWSHTRPLRRQVERPLFYEGWACLGEEIMARTGYFNERWDPFLLARRRLRRAVRGLVDLSLQTGRSSLEEAAAKLEKVGLSPDAAHSAARKYALRPGYQVCYTVGLKRFLAMMDLYGSGDIPAFARTVLSQGEIGFEDLEQKLKSGRDR